MLKVKILNIVVLCLIAFNIAASDYDIWMPDNKGAGYVSNCSDASSCEAVSVQRCKKKGFSNVVWWDTSAKVWVNTLTYEEIDRPHQRPGATHNTIFTCNNNGSYISAQSKKSITLPTDCVKNTISTRHDGYEIVFYNKCGATINVNVCAVLENRKPIPSVTNSAQLESNAQYAFTFVDFDKGKIKYEYRYCSPDNTTRTDNCPAKCPSL